MGVRTRAASSKGTVSSVPAWFRADSGANLFNPLVPGVSYMLHVADLVP